jgi:hypothetical protein
VTEKSLPIFLLVAALIVAGCIAIGVWWLSIPIVLVLLPGPFMTPAILASLASRRSGAQFQKTIRAEHVRFTEDDEQTLTS